MKKIKGIIASLGLVFSCALMTSCSTDMVKKHILKYGRNELNEIEVSKTSILGYDEEERKFAIGGTGNSMYSTYIFLCFFDERDSDINGIFEIVNSSNETLLMEFDLRCRNHHPYYVQMRKYEFWSYKDTVLAETNKAFQDVGNYLIENDLPHIF